MGEVLLPQDLYRLEKKGDVFSSLETSQNHLSNVLTLLMLMFSKNFSSDSVEIVWCVCVSHRLSFFPRVFPSFKFCFGIFEFEQCSVVGLALLSLTDSYDLSMPMFGSKGSISKALDHLIITYINSYKWFTMFHLYVCFGKHVGNSRGIEWNTTYLIHGLFIYLYNFWRRNKTLLI